MHYAIFSSFVPTGSDAPLRIWFVSLVILFSNIYFIIKIYICYNPCFEVRSATNSVKIEPTPKPEMVRHLGRQFPPVSVILTYKHHQIWIQRRKIVQVQQRMEIFL